MQRVKCTFSKYLLRTIIIVLMFSVPLKYINNLWSLRSSGHLGEPKQFSANKKQLATAQKFSNRIFKQNAKPQLKLKTPELLQTAVNWDSPGKNPWNQPRLLKAWAWQVMPQHLIFLFFILFFCWIFRSKCYKVVAAAYAAANACNFLIKLCANFL